MMRKASWESPGSAVAAAGPDPARAINKHAADLGIGRNGAVADDPAVGKPAKEPGERADPQRAVRAFGERPHLPELAWSRDRARRGESAARPEDCSRTNKPPARTDPHPAGAIHSQGERHDWLAASAPSEYTVNGRGAGSVDTRCQRSVRQASAARRRIGIGSQPGQPTRRGDPVHARSGLDDLFDLRMRQSVLGPVVDEPAAIEPAQTIGRAEPEKTPRISKDAADAIVGESIGRVVGVEGQALGLQAAEPEAAIAIAVPRIRASVPRWNSSTGLYITREDP